MPELEEKIAIITGGGKGIGAAASAAFAKEGALVVVADLDREAGEATAKAIRESGDKAVFVEADVALAPGAQSVVRRAVDSFGGVDILFNNVGIQPLESYKNAEELPEELWDRIMAVNVKSYFLMAKYAIPEMKKRGGGVIVNTASVQGLQSTHAVPAYAASKGAVLSLTRNLALDYAASNIRVLAVCPGGVDTPLLRVAMESFPSGDVAAEMRKLARSHPMNRVGTPEEIANVVVFLASPKASFMTGEWVCVDGGIMAAGSWMAPSE